MSPHDLSEPSLRGRPSAAAWWMFKWISFWLNQGSHAIVLLVSWTSKGTLSSSTGAYRASVFPLREPRPAGVRLLSITECRSIAVQFIPSPPQVSGSLTLGYRSASCSGHTSPYGGLTSIHSLQGEQMVNDSPTTHYAYWAHRILAKR